MCQFFSFLITTEGGVYYHDAKARARRRKAGDENTNDSHASIASTHHLNEDNCAKFEYNPITKDLKVDNIPDHWPDDKRNEVGVKARVFVKHLDMKTIIPCWLPTSKHHPMRDVRKHPTRKLTKAQISMVRELHRYHNCAQNATVRAMYLLNRDMRAAMAFRVNGDSTLCGFHDQLRAVEDVGWLPKLLRHKSITPTRRRLITHSLALIKAGLNPTSLARHNKYEVSAHPASRHHEVDRFIINLRTGDVTKRRNE